MTTDDIDKLTIGEVRLIAERAGDALRLLRELNLGGAVASPATRPATGGGQSPTVFAAAAPPISGEPFPCVTCGRVRPERPGESVQTATCDTCGNRLPGGTVSARVMNKGEERRNGVTTAIVTPLTPEERAAKMAMPAFDGNGMPVDE